MKPKKGNLADVVAEMLKMEDGDLAESIEEAVDGVEAVKPENLEAYLIGSGGAAVAMGAFLLEGDAWEAKKQQIVATACETFAESFGRAIEEAREQAQQWWLQYGEPGDDH